SDGDDWLLWGAVALGVVSLAVFLFVWLRRSPAEAPVRRGSDKPALPAAKPVGEAVIALRCPACGKNLKVKGTLAGKKVKCPGCGKAVAVPATTSLPDASGPPPKNR